MRVIVRGVDQAVHDFAPTTVAGRLEPAFAEMAHELQAAAREEMAGHHYTGAAAASVVAEAHGGSIGGLEARIQSEDPAVGALAFGWHGHGTQPPIEPIAAWLAFRGKDPAAAFAVARAIGRRGFSFRPLETFTRAWQRLEPRVTGIVDRALAR